MSRVGRGYPDARYEDREREYNPNPRRRGGGREYEEVDIDITRTKEPEFRRPPDFLREDHGRVRNAELVVRQRERRRSPSSGSDSGPPPSRRGQREERPREREERPREDRPREREDRPREQQEWEIETRKQRVIGRDGDREREREPPRQRRGPLPRNEYEEEEVIIHRRHVSDDSPPARERGPPPRERMREEVDVDIDIRQDERRQRQRPREENLEIDIRREDRLPRNRGPASRRDDEEEDPRPRRRAPPIEEIDVDIRRESKGRPRRPPPREEEIDINIRREEPRERIVYKERSPPRPIAREREEYVYRRREPERPPPVVEKEEIIIRQKQRARSPSPESSEEELQPAPEVMKRPAIVQEVFTHYHNIDHGMRRASPSPEPEPEPPKRDERLEIEIRRRDDRGRTYTEDIRLFDAPKERPRSAKPPRLPSPSPPPRSRPARVAEREEIDINIDERYARAAPDRSLAIRVAAPAMIPPQVVAERPRKPKEMWTEITKDLVTKEGIESYGWSYEEQEDFFYIYDYLTYEQVCELVARSDDLSVTRKKRIEQIQWERKDPRRFDGEGDPPRREEKRVKAIEEDVVFRRPSPMLPLMPVMPGYYDNERIYEREIVYEDARPRRGGEWR